MKGSYPPVFQEVERRGKKIKAEDPMVIVKLDISNAFGSLGARLVLDVLSSKPSRDYPCGIKRFDQQE